mgnify:CR=1 FL=1
MTIQILRLKDGCDIITETHNINGGMIELESKSSQAAYSKVLILAVGSFLGDAAFKLRKRNDSNSSKES